MNSKQNSTHPRKENISRFAVSRSCFVFNANFSMLLFTALLRYTGAVNHKIRCFDVKIGDGTGVSSNKSYLYFNTFEFSRTGYRPV